MIFRHKNSYNLALRFRSGEVGLGRLGVLI